MRPSRTRWAARHRPHLPSDVVAAPLEDADALAAAISFLSTHERVIAALGGEGRVRGTNEPPYPRLRLSSVPGSDRDLRWLLAPAVRLEALGDLDGSQTSDELRRILYIALGALTEMPEQEYGPGEPVVTNVASAGAGGSAPLPTGQPRWMSTVGVSIHPSAAPAIPTP
jgi:hypothetical protein